MIGLLISILVGCFAASLGEYWVHRAMHRGALYGVEHFLHHSLNQPQGWLYEYWAYLKASGLLLAGVAVGVYAVFGEWTAAGWLIGSVGYLGFSAYTHMVYHVDPNLVFWIKRPIHLFHHSEDRSHHNFGVTTDVWDRVFGTYKDDPSWTPRAVPLRRIFAIPWL